jgi:Holliday junction DNA helicase RuvA
MAERLILELKEKVIKKMMTENAPVTDDQHQVSEIIVEDVLSALVNLGYKSNIAREALDKILRSSEEKLGMDKLLKKTLKLLAG